MNIKSTHIFIIGFTLVLFSVFAPKTEAETMRIAVASSAQAKDATISRQAGRTPYFLFFDGRGNFLESIENPVRDQSRKAGPDAALFLADQGVTLVIAGEFGKKMKQALEEHHIHYIEKTGVVDHVVQTIIQDR
ncbi:MAG: NifB/NifX family molybdenum-iron cluster-binding protein [Pseudomonadota bacterium]|nr:NifB/NifX family molybdenum-iron cluster-binding protein [Pseudomonadota bacterium]